MFHPSFLSNPTPIPIGSGAGASERAGREEEDSGDDSEGEESEDEVNLDDDVHDIFTSLSCLKCGHTHSKNANSMLLCDGRDCDNGLHQKCADPVIKRVPQGSWYCPSCVGTFVLLQFVGELLRFVSFERT